MFCQTPMASANFELNLLSPCHKNNNKKKNRRNKNKKNPQQNLPAGSKLKVWNFEHRLNLMEEDLQWKRTSDERQLMMEDGR